VNEARSIALRAGGGLAGITAIVACTAENCIDINTHLVAVLRAADYVSAKLTASAATAPNLG